MVKVFFGRCMLITLVCGLLVGGASLSAMAQASLTAGDCVKCHDQQPAEIEANGAAHKTEIDCQACHEGHRPKVANNIPQCSNCHSGTSHYEVPECMSCHNPHQPLDVKLKGELKAVCLTCHAGPGEQMVASPSKHAEVACNFCHAETHGNIPNCVACHSPHSETMVQNDCAACHKAHKPLELMYGPDTGSALCASCHDTAFSQLAVSKSKHNQVACVTCHANKHKTVPQCSDCHGMPHAQSMHTKFPKCGDCHNTAHDLNNWPAK
jgi:predicted CXXCH cytochrome family protein